MQNPRLKQHQQQQQQQAMMQQQALMQQHSFYHPGVLAPPQVFILPLLHLRCV
jgi:nucleolysin TIA-1/TIAR